jgi:uncharacterized small protein (DUF1192 family)
MVKRFILLIYFNESFFLNFRFVDPVAQDVVSVKSFDGRWEVSTFRTIGTKNFIFVFFFLLSFFVLVELPNDFSSMQEEIERQKAALLEKTKSKETLEVSGKDFLNKLSVKMFN